MTLRKRIPLARLVLSDVSQKMGLDCARNNLDYLNSHGVRGNSAERLAGCAYARIYSISETLSEYNRWKKETRYNWGDIIDIITSPGYPLLGSWKDKLNIIEEIAKKNRFEITPDTVIRVALEEPRQK